MNNNHRKSLLALSFIAAVVFTSARQKMPTRASLSH
jgi:hypothetical protein